ncbi:MAG: DUF444 family protein [Candidatus Aenigmarchaeota archaeon]|nr:DUF444 family protein [Candidatus Aenigmarchaeota archaeon]
MSLRRVKKGKIAESLHDQKLIDYLLSENRLINLMHQSEVLIEENGKVIRVDLRVLELPYLRFAEHYQGIGMGEGKPGDVLGELAYRGVGTGGGKELGQEYYEEVTFKELFDLWALRLGLPTPEQYKKIKVRKAKSELIDLALDGEDLDLEETALRSMLRTAKEEGKPKLDVSKADLIYDEEVPERMEERSALEIYVRDISGSMDDHKRLLVWSMCNFLCRYLGVQYKDNLRKFANFQTVAKEVDQKNFFEVSSTGGTHISTGFGKALEIASAYPNHDKYLFFFSDSENESGDNKKAYSALDGVLKDFSRICYGHTQTGAPHTDELEFSKYVIEKSKANSTLIYAPLTNLQSIGDGIRKFLELGVYNAR